MDLQDCGGRFHDGTVPAFQQQAQLLLFIYQPWAGARRTRVRCSHRGTSPIAEVVDELEKRPPARAIFEATSCDRIFLALADGRVTTASASYPSTSAQRLQAACGEPLYDSQRAQHRLRFEIAR
jgi:hypothetical protein